MKKLLVLGLAAGVGASTLTGCFGKKTSVPSG